MKKIAIAGTGVIGTMMGGFLAKAGYDVTVVSQFRREAAGFINNNGITVRFNEIEFNTKVRAVFVD
ncbi:MAG: 2-dehydropantoate 2-reductase, partial [Clostridiales bacterium]|nr:2-dehydropantoate 2-reductase [Clostridiales bacterium]